jgi:small-conductance mechanosensitive channel
VRRLALRRGGWVLLAMLWPGAPLLAGQTTAPPPAAVQDPEAQEESAPVLLGGEPVIWISAGAGPYSARYRADRISGRLEEVVHDRLIRDPTLTIVEAGAATELRAGPRLLMVVTERDAASLGAPSRSIAREYARDLEAAIRAERARYAPGTLLRSGLYGLLATLLFAAALWLIRHLTRAMHRGLAGWLTRRAASIRALHGDIFTSDRLGRSLTALIRTLRLLLVLLAFNFYVTYVLGLFPWTRAISIRLLGYVIAPIRAIAEAFAAYLPNLVFLIVIVAVVYFAIRLVGLFFRRIAQGRLVFANFPPEWADPTNKIARVLLLAFGVVVAFPYLPASDSPAFAGVSVFMGVLFSLSSSSAFSNMIAGIVLTYTGAFRLGDRVKVGDAFGDVVQTTLLATRVRTIKNEDITIPNSIALGSAVTNYSRSAGTLGLILHTSVTIGYDAPWRKVHDLLVRAALETPGVLPEPRPFVWQTALNDFYVTYEINAYTATPRDMIDIYAALHERIQDRFYEAGVEIMSPHYTALRDGNAVAIPEALRTPGYRAPAFRVEERVPVPSERLGP